MNNKSKITRFILQKQQTSKAEVAKCLGLSMPTVLQNIKKLMEENIVVEVGEYDSTGGRKAKSLAVNRSIAYSLGIDLTAEYINLVLVDLTGALIFHEKKRRHFSFDLEYFVGVVDEVNAFIAKASIERNKILGVGISLPGIVDNENQILLKSHALGLENVSLKMLAQAMSYPVYFENDANAAIMAELKDQRNDMIYLSLSNTVGGAVFMNGSLFRGDNQKAGEFGHMILVPEGRPCYCGKKGCVDAYCSALRLSEKTGGSLEQFMTLLEQDDSERGVVLDLWENYLNDLAITIANLRMVYDMDIILGGYVGQYLEKYMMELRRKVMSYNLFDSDVSYLKTCSYYREASAVGVTGYFIEKYIEELV